MKSPEPKITFHHISSSLLGPNLLETILVHIMQCDECSIACESVTKSRAHRSRHSHGIVTIAEISKARNDIASYALGEA